MADNVPVESGWLTPELQEKVRVNKGFYYFKDAGFHCVLMHPEVAMNVISRQKTELFSTTAENARRANPRIRLILNGSYGGNSFTAKAAALAAQPQKPDQPIEGQVVIQERYITGSFEPDKASVAWNTDQAPNQFTFALGNPDPTSTGGIGGLVPLILGGKKYGLAPPDVPNTWFTKVHNNGAYDGRLALARSAEFGHLLAFLQPIDFPVLTVEGISHKLFTADMSDAVLLDGSDSVMMNVDGVPKVQQGYKKDSVTRIGLVFWAEHPDNLGKLFHGSRTAP